MITSVVGIFIDGGLGVKVTGCDIEGNGGPGIIVFQTRTLTIDSNYFEANNKVRTTAAELYERYGLSYLPLIDPKLLLIDPWLALSTFN